MCFAYVYASMCLDEKNSMMDSFTFLDYVNNIESVL